MMSKNKVAACFHRVILSVATFGLACVFSVNARAQDDIQQVRSWEYELTPYLWATRMNGNVSTANVPSTNVDLTFSDVLENLDFGFMLAFEARKDRWGILLDGMYMKVSDSAMSQIAGSNLQLGADVQIKQSMLAAALAYRILDGDKQTALDLLGGVRYNKIDVDAQIDAQWLGLSGTVNRAGEKDWLDPYIGMRLIQPLNASWNIDASIDVGGFGLGSDYAVQLMTGLSYAYSPSSTMKIGYRYMKMDYSDDDFHYKMANDGLYAGLGVRF